MGLEVGMELGGGYAAMGNFNQMGLEVGMELGVWGGGGHGGEEINFSSNFTFQFLATF